MSYPGPEVLQAAGAPSAKPRRASMRGARDIGEAGLAGGAQGMRVVGQGGAGIMGSLNFIQVCWEPPSPTAHRRRAI